VFDAAGLAPMDGFRLKAKSGLEELQGGVAIAVSQAGVCSHGMIVAGRARGRLGEMRGLRRFEGRTGCYQSEGQLKLLDG